MEMAGAIPVHGALARKITGATGSNETPTKDPATSLELLTSSPPVWLFRPWDFSSWSQVLGKIFAKISPYPHTHRLYVKYDMGHQGWPAAEEARPWPR